ncbi:MAG: type II toxin-antitoxin system HipA family toxin [Hydrogenophaga sp.]|uniref:type II toxin-antitoxin system HipA family toxin n=1 Tax=Hydrogenophaga sp. TaxID=1904254 RepID=UPI00272FFEBA|nr:type II toxin-antitoxin system HipA family toxin [Hydrogenophaga sp.]MDP2405089.1 type II toxin-antitoxin system HipA family toxin [Hydrogenophaga sp.]MDZ4176023.1 type II toxin-antitoxin system HipA family toxin [Hydrogenophaga sp.]
MNRELQVWLHGARIGTLVQVDGRLAFSYLPEWLNNKQAIPLSQSLPLRPEAFDDRAARPFFAGLLPEGDKRRLVAQALGVSRQNDFALLDGIGGECAGAVTLLKPGQTPSNAAPSDAVRWLDDADLIKLLAEMPRRPMLAGDGDLRLSLAGAQDKLPVVVLGERNGLPLLGSPSTHILKPAIEGVEGSVFNEGFCMALARAMGLDAAPTEIRQVQGQPYLLVQRYDRLRPSIESNAAGQLTGPTQRLHQEDFCQALGVPPELKYQNEGGPDLAQAFALVRSATRPNAPQILKLLSVVLFNSLVGNHDAHAKNFSLLYTPRGAVLAPLYDALSTAVYPQFTDKMAMKVGSKYRFAELHARHWVQFAESAGLSPAQVKKELKRFAERLPDQVRRLRTEFLVSGLTHPVLSQISDLIEDRCATTLRRLAMSPADAAAETDTPGEEGPAP